METIPLYKQIENHVMDCIHNSIYPQGMVIPSEEEFCNMFHTSRMTVRKAIDSLAAKGIVHRIKGKGTFVNKFNIEKTMNSVTGWRETMQAAGHTTKSKVLKFTSESCDEDVARNLNIVPGSKVYVLERLRYADDMPVLIEKAYLNAVFFKDFLSHEFLEDSLYEVMEREYDIRLSHVYQKLHTEKITGKYAQLLFDKDEETAMVMENTSYDHYTRPIEYTICCINGERYALRYVVNKT